MTLAERLKLAMDESQITQGALAKKSGLAQSMIWKLLNGQAKGSTKMLELSKALGVRIEWLTDGEEPMKNQGVGIISNNDEVVYYNDVFPVEFYDEEGATGTYVMAPMQIKSDSCKAFKLLVNSGCSDAPAGTIIIVDTAEKSGTGDLIYAGINNIYSVYKLVQGGDSGFLSVDDPRVPLIPIDSNIDIVGVIVYLLRNLKRR